MTPTMCRVKHDPPRSYGDCLRGLTITALGLAGPPDEQEHTCSSCGAKSVITVDEGNTLEGVLDWMGKQNPDTTWMLFGSTAPEGRSGEDHVVVCQGGSVVHDPAWVPSSIKGVGSCGYWEVWVVSKK